MINLDTKNIDFHAALAVVTENAQSTRSLLPESGADVSQYGRSMIEMLGVLAIIGVLSVGGIAGYSKAMMKYKINKTIEQITLIAGNIRAFFAPQRSYENLSLNPECLDRNDNMFNGYVLIKKAKLVPEEMIIDEEGFDGQIGSLQGEFSDFSLERENKSAENDYKAFSIGLNVPEEACIELLSQDWTNAGVNLFYLDGGPSYAKYFIPPIDVATVVEECSTAFSNGYGLSLVFYFDVDIKSNYWSSMLNP
ncbi:MAG: hypothetical protein IJ525_05090 [Alphaproteobacteria bacterium]|nr:hypothetical protein [Alphaproteobacteria bacterium]